MKSPFTKKLFRIKNKSHHAYLIIAPNSEEALNIAMKLKFAKKIENLTYEDVSDSYITQERLNKGLNYDLLADGWFTQKIDGNKSSWHTTQ